MRLAAEKRANDWQTNGVLLIPNCKFVEAFRIEPTEGYLDFEIAINNWRELADGF